MATEQLPKDRMLSALNEVRIKLLDLREFIGAAIVKKSCEEIIAMADENERLRAEVIDLELNRRHIAELISGHDGYVFQDIAKALGIQPDEEQS